jgi:hypothetical protein
MAIAQLVQHAQPAAHSQIFGLRIERQVKIFTLRLPHLSQLFSPVEAMALAWFQHRPQNQG